MRVQKVDGITVHFTNGNSIRFSDEETHVQVVQTVQENEDGSVKTPVEYYIITTTPLER